MTRDQINRVLAYARRNGAPASNVAIGYALVRIEMQLERIADAFQQKPKDPEMQPRVEEAND